jgi:hypothetical protein
MRAFHHPVKPNRSGAVEAFLALLARTIATSRSRRPNDFLGATRSEIAGSVGSRSLGSIRPQGSSLIGIA